MSALQIFRSCLIALLLCGLFSTAAFAAPKETSPRRTPVVPVELPEQAVARGITGERTSQPAPQPADEAPTAGAPAAEAPADETTVLDLRAMSFNIHHGVGTDGVLDLERTAQVIEASGAHVVALQEVDRNYGSRSNWVDQPTWLAERLGMYVVYGANIDLAPLRADQPRRQYGNAVLSTFPIVSAVNHPLPNHGTEQRGALDVTLEVNGAAVRVIGTHLTNLGGYELLDQTTAIADLVAGGSDTVVLGDFNATPGSMQLEPMAALQDAWAVTQSRRAPGYTFPASAPSARIDYGFATADVTVDASAVVATLASDHLPLVIDVTIG